MIRAAKDVPGGFVTRTEVCVIGSGAGGGVAAALAAEAGRDVIVLEEGPYVPKEQMTQREEEMYPLLYRNGGNQMTDDGGISVLQGRVLGGSTVVNMADVEPIPEAILAHWRAHFGVDRYGGDEVSEAARACAAAIGTNRIAPEDLNRNNALLVQGAEKVGLSARPFDQNRVGCIGSGYCLVGCAYDAKRSVALTWIPRALAKGALVQTEARVERLEVDGTRVRAAVGALVDPISQRIRSLFRVEADEFVLAAGAIHSPLLLLASGIGGPAVGRNLSLQPQAPAVALFRDDVVLYRGIPQAAFTDGTQTATEAGGLGGFRIEGISATPGMAATVTALGPEALAMFMGRFRQAAAALCLVPDRPGGRVTRGRYNRPKIRYTLSDAAHATLKEAVRTAARIYLAAGAEQVLLPFPEATPVRSERDLAQLDALRFRSASSPIISAHPQGTCRMGPDPSTSVVGLDLKVHGTENLRVLDASVFPTTSSSHTMLPTMTFAWLGSRDLLA